MLEKKALSPEVLEAQTAMELPDREMMALIDITVGDVTVDIEDVNLGVCANVNVIGVAEQHCSVNQQ